MDDNFCKQIEQLARAAQDSIKAFEPMRLEVERMAEFAARFSEPLRNQFATAALQTAGIAESFSREIEEHAKQIDAWFAKSRETTEAFARQMHQLAHPEWLGEVARELEELPKRTWDDLRALATRGWYLDPNMAASAPTHLKQAI